MSDAECTSATGLMIGGIGMIGMMHFTDYGMIHDMRYTAVGGWWF